MSGIAYLVSDYSAPSHTFVWREISALRGLGTEIAAFSIRPTDDNNADVEAVLGRPLIQYPAALIQSFFTSPRQFLSSWLLALRHRSPGARGLLWSQFHFVEALCFARLLTSAGCSRVHNHFANGGATVGMIAAHFCKIPWSVTLHGISETDYPAGLLLAEKLERADFVACASFFMRAQAMRRVRPDQWDKMHIIRCGVDLSVLPVSKDRGEQHETRIICVGRLSPEKGYFGLLQVMANLIADGLNLSLTIVGGGPAEDDIRDQIRALELSETVRLAGALPEAETLEQISRSDIFVLPSLMEGLPVVLIEALAMGKAVLASRVAGIPELIKDGHSGLLFTPSDWQDMENQLRRLLSDAALQKSLGKHGRQVVEQDFAIGIPARKLANLFDSV